MTEEKSRFTFLITYGKSEAQATQQVDLLIERGLLPNNKSEIFRRGLHCCKILAQVDEEPLLKILSETVRSLMITHDAILVNWTIQSAQSISNTVLSIMIAKSGVQQTDVYRRLALRINELMNKVTELLNEKKWVIGKQMDIVIPEAIKDEARKITTTIDTLYVVWVT